MVTSTNKWSVVVPSNRPESLKSFETAWMPLFQKHDVNLIVVEDAPKTWRTMPDFIPRRTDMIRSWGFYKAFRGDSEYTLTLDDDVRPDDTDPFEAYEKEFKNGRPFSEFLSVGSLTSSGLEMRGMPYKDRKPVTVGVQYGGWNNVLDYDAATQLAHPRDMEFFEEVVVPVPKGVPTTCCIMNCAFATELTPIMWQLPMLDGRYNRVGDIWSGLFQKKVLDSMGQVMLINGNASVIHDRASDPFKNIEREAPGLKINEHLWENLEDGDYQTVTDSAYRYFKKHDKEYAEHFRKCRDKWLDLF